MFKKILSLVLALMIVMSAAVIAASAAQVEVVDDAADVPAEVGADAAADTGADASADTGASSKVVYFDTNSTDWNNYSVIMVYLYRLDNNEVLINWGSKKKGGMTDGGDGIWSFDFEAKGYDLEDGVQYGMIFSADTGVQTCDIIFDTTCYGDTAYTEPGNMVENTADSNKRSVIVRWRNSTTLGPVKAVTSIGNVVGEIIPAHTTAYGMLVDFLKNTLANARVYAKNDDGTLKTDQQIIDDTASALGLGQDLIPDAIAEAGVTVEWEAAKSEAPKTSDSGSGGSGSSGSGSGSSGSGSGSGGGSDSSGSGSGGSSGGTSGGSSGGSSKTGSGSNSKTGQDTGVLFVMLGVMAAAAGVIFITRRKARG